MRAEIGALWHVLAQEPIGVLVRSPLPRAMWIAEIDSDAGVDTELVMAREFLALIPGNRSHEFSGQIRDCRLHCLIDVHRCPTVGKMQQKQEAGAPFNEGPDGGPTALSDNGGSDRSALPAFELVGFSGPPAEPDVQLSPHPALHRFMPVVRGDPLSCRSSMVSGCGRADSGIG